MLFNSFTFVVFLAGVLPLYYALSYRGQNRMLTLASCVFYGAWSLGFLGLLLLSIFVDYTLGHALHTSRDPKRRKWLVAGSCVLNLGVLAFFKYANFLVGSATGLLHLFHLPVPSIYVNVLLPIGISFYTFHSMSYIIDIYRRVLIPLHSFGDYALYVLYFPQLVAGPIARASFLIPQIHSPRQVTYDDVVQGSWLMLWGFFKKLVIADNVALVADSVFSAPATSGLTCLVGVYAFALQIYGDFSGYTDIARGIAKLMGIELAFNFNLPYLAKNPAELWRRWHISLSTWLRDYLYIPLGGNRRGEIKTYRNLLLTMLLGGLWHGAAWHFVAWGGYHGTLLAGHRFVTRDSERAMSGSPLITLVKLFVMFHLTCFGWLLFRAANIQQIGEFCAAIFSRFHLEHGAIPLIATVVFLAALLWGLEAWLRNSDDPRTRPLWKRGLGPVTVACLIGAIIVFTPGDTREFIYFRF
jgi:D-alanyl-lipoteichoic acid acyltransferase DltB (MBOAT superfamily)